MLSNAMYERPIIVIIGRAQAAGSNRAGRKVNSGVGAAGYRDQVSTLARRENFRNLI